MNTAVIVVFVNLFVFVFNILILARVIMSWIPSIQNNAFGRLIHELTEPVLAPIRKLVGGGMIDLSPLIAFFLLQALQQLVYYLVS